VPVRATSDLRKTQDDRSLSLRERARVRGNETPPTKTAGPILQAQLDRLPQSVACGAQKQISRRALRTTGVSRQTHWCFERCFPLTPALSLRERENLPPRLRQSRAPGLVATRDALFPLPEGEGKGEGESDAANQNDRTNFASSIRPAPRASGLWYPKTNLPTRAKIDWRQPPSALVFRALLPPHPGPPLGRARMLRRPRRPHCHFVVYLAESSVGHRA
jgi:hypothetical protein